VQEALRVNDEDQIILAVAWVCDDEHCLFQLFPEVNFWDTAQKTNREKRPLFLAWAKDSEGLRVVALRTYVLSCPLSASGYSSGCTPRICPSCWVTPP
jgi:hypothetical protein